MLYNPAWDFKKLASLDNFIAWLETKPPEQTYNWFDCHGACLLGQYMSEHGIAWSMEAYQRLRPREFILCDGEWTFGAALERAKQAKI